MNGRRHILFCDCHRPTRGQCHSRNSPPMTFPSLFQLLVARLVRMAWSKCGQTDIDENNLRTNIFKTALETVREGAFSKKTREYICHLETEGIIFRSDVIQRAHPTASDNIQHLTRACISALEQPIELRVRCVEVGVASIVVEAASSSSEPTAAASAASSAASLLGVAQITFTASFVVVLNHQFLRLVLGRGRS